MGHLYSAHSEGELIKGVLIPGEMALWELLSHLLFIYEQDLSCNPAEVWNEFIKKTQKKNKLGSKRLKITGCMIKK